MRPKPKPALLVARTQDEMDRYKRIKEGTALVTAVSGSDDVILLWFGVTPDAALELAEYLGDVDIEVSIPEGVKTLRFSLAGGKTRADLDVRAREYVQPKKVQ